MLKKVILPIILIIAAFVVGIMAGMGMNKKGAQLISKMPPEGGKYQNTFADGWQAARQKLIDSGFTMMKEANSLSGQIKEVDSKKGKIIFTTNLLNPLDDEELKTRTALVNEKTEIILRKQKSTEEINKEREDKKKDLPALKDQMEKTADQAKKMELQMNIMNLEMGMIDYYKEEKVKIIDLKQGLNIRVEAEENIAEKQEFAAKKIIAEDMGGMAAGAPMMGVSGNNVPPPPSPPANVGATNMGAIPPPPPPASAVNSATDNTKITPPPAGAGAVNTGTTPPPPPPPLPTTTGGNTATSAR